MKRNFLIALKNLMPVLLSSNATSRNWACASTFCPCRLPYSGYWRRRWPPTPVPLPGKSHGQRSLVGCSPWGREETDMTERLPFHFSLSYTGEGNGNPLQCSCLENPRNRGAWWAAVHGVTQSRTRLKWLSSSSSIFPYMSGKLNIQGYSHQNCF